MRGQPEDLQSAMTNREEERSELNCSFEDMLMTDMVGGRGVSERRWWGSGKLLCFCPDCSICHQPPDVNTALEKRRQRRAEDTTACIVLVMS